MNRWIFILLFLAVGAAAAAFFLRPASAPAPVDITFYFTCDTRGRLVPCGCFTGQYGGLTRLKTVLENERAPNAIRVDVGDAIRGTTDYNFIEYKYILQAYHDMSYDALNLGQREAQLSLAQLEEIRAKSPVTLLSANLLRQDTGQPVFAPFKIVERGPSKIAIVGVMDPRGLGDQLDRAVVVQKMETTLGSLLPELKKKADMLVLLAFTDEATLAALAREFYEIDVILGGKVSQSSQELRKENRSVILYTANESRTLGILNTRLAGSKVEVLSHDIHLLHDRIPEHHAVRALAGEYRDEIRRTRLDIDDPEKLREDTIPGVRMAASYIGSDSCVECHPAAGKIWKDSAHSHAFSTLVNHKADADPNCVGCHTVGFGTPSGYRREFSRAKLTDVGCESCHGPGSLHVQQHESGEAITFKFRPLGSGDCQKCHYGEFSRPFDWDTFWPEIAHGKEVEKQQARLENPWHETDKANP